MKFQTRRSREPFRSSQPAFRLGSRKERQQGRTRFVVLSFGRENFSKVSTELTKLSTPAAAFCRWSATFLGNVPGQILACHLFYMPSKRLEGGETTLTVKVRRTQGCPAYTPRFSHLASSSQLGNSARAEGINNSSRLLATHPLPASYNPIKCSRG